jgi:hypothetical protein
MEYSTDSKLLHHGCKPTALLTVGEKNDGKDSGQAHTLVGVRTRIAIPL